jgi:uncharacterized membrane protein YqjE
MASSEIRKKVEVDRIRSNGDPAADGRSIGQLLKELSTEGRTLVRQEVELARAELSEKVQVYTDNVMAMAVAGALLLIALLAVSTAVVYGLIVLFDQFLPFGIAVWLAPLLLGVVLGAIGWGRFKQAKARLARESVIPQRTVATLREDKDWVQSKVR